MRRQQRERQQRGHKQRDQQHQQQQLNDKVTGSRPEAEAECSAQLAPTAANCSG